MISYPYSRFPAIEPYAIHQLPVSLLHTLYVEEVGNPQGIPVIYLHGGPGTGTLPHYRCYFDPNIFHVILFSQRGCLPSSPAGEIRENDTWLLVEDIEKLRTHFGIRKWIVYGGSWGSTLALAYAEHHREHVAALVLRGIFLGRQRELDWLYRPGGIERFFPDAWQEFVGLIPVVERGDLIAAYYQRLFGTDEGLCFSAAQRWNAWEDGRVTLLPHPPLELSREQQIAMARIECHYMQHHLFLEKDDILLQEAGSLAQIPTHIVQGRYDMVCPPESAFRLVEKIPQAHLNIVADGGHSGSEPGITSGLIAALEDLNSLFSCETDFSF